MSGFELISAFQGSVDLNSQVLFGYVSIMSAFLVMSYLVAHKLPLFLASIVLALFSVVSGLLIFRMYLNGGDAAALMAHMQTQQRLGNLDLAGFGENPIWAAPFVVTLEILSTIGGYFGCIAFFLYRRLSDGESVDSRAATPSSRSGRRRARASGRN